MSSESSNATSGEDLLPDVREGVEDVQEDAGEHVSENRGETLQADESDETIADVESSETSADQHGERTAVEGAAADELTGEPLGEPTDASAHDPDGAASEIASAAEQSPSAAPSTPAGTTPVSEAYVPVDGSSIAAQSSSEQDAEPAPQAEPERAPDEAHDSLGDVPEAPEVAMSVEGAAEDTSSVDEVPIEPSLTGAREDEGASAEAISASGEPRFDAPLDVSEQPADDAPPELDLADQPTEVAPAWSDLAEQAPQQELNTPSAWGDDPTLADPAYSPPVLPNATPVEPWMASALSPEYEPPAAAYDSARTPPIDARMIAEATGRARRYPSAASPLPEYPADYPNTHPTEYSTEYPRAVYPLPIGRRSRLPLFGISAAVILAALIVVLLAHNAISATQPPTSSMLYSSAMTTSSSSWPSDKECYFSHDGYHIVDNSNCYYSGAQYQDATVTVTATVLKGPPNAAYGIAFRRPSANNFYIFLVTNNGDWFLVKDNAALQKAVPSSAIKTGVGATNVLSVHMRGAHFTFFANGSQLGELTDDTYSTGAVGLSGDVGLNVVFRNFSVTRA